MSSSKLTVQCFSKAAAALSRVAADLSDWMTGLGCCSRSSAPPRGEAVAQLSLLILLLLELAVSRIQWEQEVIKGLLMDHHVVLLLSVPAAPRGAGGQRQQRGSCQAAAHQPAVTGV